FSSEDMDAIRNRKGTIEERVASRKEEITHLLRPPEETQVEIVSESDSHQDQDSVDRMEEIRRSVADDRAGSPPSTTEQIQPEGGQHE
ncbi:MAG: SPFH domain-containing protein, partial [Ornithinimicrobium sp.]